MGVGITNYRPPGPIGAAFLKSRGPIDTIMGPGGSGKTVCSVMKGPMIAAQYMPVCKDGWVRVKTLCVRNTYRSFAKTALESWYGKFPIGHEWQVSHEGGQDRPVVHKLQWIADRGREKVKVEYIMETGAVGDNDLEEFAKGYEISMAWVNEYDLMPEKTLPLFLGRCGRYPPMEMIAPSELERVSRDGRTQMRRMGLEISDTELVVPQIAWGDMNPPDVDHPAYTIPFGQDGKPGTIVQDITPGWNGFWQPGGLSPHAENRAGKPRSSYQKEEATTKDKAVVRRMVHSLPAYAKDGKPVYEDDFSVEFHCADQEIQFVPQLGLTIGIDAGGSPAATFGQMSPSGQNRLLAELTADPGTGPTRFGHMILSLMMGRFAGAAFVHAWGDPSAWYGADSATGEFHWINTLQSVVRFQINPAPSNEPSIRQEAVKHFLGLRLDNNTPGYIIDPSCKVVRGGFAAHYKFTKKTSSSQTDKGLVDKNPYSHPHDAEQYRCLGVLGIAALTAHAAQSTLPSNVENLHRHRQDRSTGPKRDFSVWDV